MAQIVASGDKEQSPDFFAPCSGGNISCPRMCAAAADSSHVPLPAPQNSFGTVDASTPSFSMNAADAVGHDAQGASSTEFFPHEPFLLTARTLDGRIALAPVACICFKRRKGENVH